MQLSGAEWGIFFEFHPEIRHIVTYVSRPDKFWLGAAGGIWTPFHAFGILNC